MSAVDRASSHRGVVVAVAGLALVLAACGPSASATPSEPAGGASPSPSTAAGPIPLIVDNDMGLDDVMAISYLTTRPGVQLLGVTVSGTGIVHCGPGARNARNLLNELGAPAVPTACGPEQPIAGGKVFPDEWRVGADGLFGLSFAGIPGTPRGDAVELLRELIGGSDRPVTILATGPLTNIALALKADPTLADGIERVVIMGGAVDVSGNATADGSPAAAEWNFAADPTAAAQVFAAGIPITLVPLDATNDVPITQAFADALHADAKAGPANLVDELLLRNSFSIGVDYFWDQLTAVSLVESDVLAAEEARVAIVTEGADAGRSMRAADGAPVTLATGADRAAFETAFLEGLRSGGPRQTALTLEGELAVGFDGTTCAADVAATKPAGTYLLRFTNDGKGDAVGVVGALIAGATYEQLDAWFVEHPGSIDQPPMITVPGFAFAAPGKAAPAIVELASGQTFIACLVGASGSERAVSGPRFTVE